MKLFNCAVLVAGLLGLTMSHAANLVVYGGSGHIGTRIVNEALSRGHSVTVISRQQAPQTAQARLSSQPGDILDSRQVAAAITGKDVVIVSVNNPQAAFFTDAAKSVTDAMRSLGRQSPRLIWIGGASSLETEPGKRLIDATPGIVGARLGQVQVLDYLRAQKDIRWTVATPSLEIVAGQRTGKFRLGQDVLLRDAAGKSLVTMEDFALAVVDEIEKPSNIGRRFTVGY